jgi:hypothetical protein
MTDHGDQLREAFETHEKLAPDPAAVYARVQELARTYHRRRRTAQAAGGAVLGAGLIAGAMNLPTLLPGTPHDTVAVVAPAASGPATPSPAEVQKAWDAYFGAGYDYDDALTLAKIWHSKDDVGTDKAEAGRRLLAGQTLPIKPTPGDHPGTDPAADPVDAFFAAGYSYDDAVKLARLWHTSDPYQAKIAAGKKLLAGETLPIRP